MYAFSATIEIIGVNPYVFVPLSILSALFAEAKKSKGPIPIKIVLAGKTFLQNLVKYQGDWRLYLNTPMRRAAKSEVGDTLALQIAFDPQSRTIPLHPALRALFSKQRKAKETFDRLIPSRQKEILRYLYSLKTEEALQRNVGYLKSYLLGEPSGGLHALLRLKK